jgi:hypothetical protein
MAGIFDEVMDSINAKEKTTETPTTPQAGATTTTEQATNQKAPQLHNYHEDFKKTFGEKNKKSET